MGIISELPRPKPSYRFRTLILLTAIGVLFIPHKLREQTLLPLEICIELLLITRILTHGTTISATWIITLATLLLGDTFAYINHRLPGTPQDIFALSQFFYTAYITAAFLYLWGIFRKSIPSRKELACFAMLTIFWAYISWTFVLLPFIRSGNYSTPFFYISSILFHIMNAGVLTVASILGIKTYSKYWLCVTQGLVLLAVASIALAYNEGVLLDATVPFYEYGWLWGILFILAAQTFDDRDDKALAQWSDIRVKLVWIIFISNVALIGVLYVAKIFQPQNAAQLTSLLFILYAIWTLSNMLAFKISANLRDIFDSLGNSKHKRSWTKDKFFFNEIEQFAERLNTAYIKIEEQARLTAIGELSAQVAHDIRSPLAALGAALKDITVLPHEKQELVREAVKRIGEIAGDLLENYKNPVGKAAADAPITQHNLSHLIEPILAEKRAQYASRPEIAIGFATLATDAEANLEPVEFQRIISNLMNNAIESLEKGGTVTVYLSGSLDHIMLKVADNGKGIPADILAKLGQKGETHGKPGGTGLGLYHARTAIESWGGGLSIHSELGKGTTVTIKLPAPKKITRLAILVDDDALVRMNWKMAAKTQGINLKIFANSADFLLESAGWPKSTAIYLDSDLGNNLKGETIAADLKGKGFTDITLETGHPAEAFSHLPWLKVIGKEPPWKQ
jgi:signal transduction histidine kinase